MKTAARRSVMTMTRLEMTMMMMLWKICWTLSTVSLLLVLQLPMQEGSRAASRCGGGGGGGRSKRGGGQKVESQLFI